MITNVALTIAGSDSGGGAGIQADLKTFAFHCVHGASVLTCVTAQNTTGVAAVEAIAPSMVKAQIEAVTQDLKVDALKTGMLLNREIIETVAEQLQKLNLSQLVVDPVMVSRTGSRLLDEAAVTSMQQYLLPQAAIVTPNLYEAQILSGREINNLEDLKQAAIAIYEELAGAVILAKGGSLSGKFRGSDVWFDGNKLEVLKVTPVNTNNTHGTGCTLSAAICANLALGKDLWSSAIAAKQYVTKALEYALDIGAGHGPVGHFFPLLNNRSF
ncbi:bifunctional hydroxymethylpyrimidine kinase/phosphomethylpyrimidine kinase [Myxosarcina sp. GI1]|uniref:bifunctional hydroxymethylpyrimidine kinase/phosphomethylpyrimidine kinase n=1 Tax=Myxosarcina sp. GI1 TaxID=1541065 RepID=UPI00055E0C9C|nr:bifunctional hydroxymethylpyrimidine kinase/phosphomethylpyrimidine kinase [Myxosarcina sp. GI1]